LISERVIITAEEDRRLELVVPHRGEVEDFVLVDQIRHLFRFDIAQRDVELPVVTSESLILQASFAVHSLTHAVFRVLLSDTGIGTCGGNIEGGDVDSDVGFRLDRGGFRDW